jgi:predicted metal-dependent hydrolase
MEVRQVRDIEYQLLPGSDRKTTDIVIERDGAICVRAPRQMTPEQVDDTVFSKRMWIYRNLAEWRDLNAARVAREWVSGESFLYLGRHYRLDLVRQQDVPLKLKNGRFTLLRAVVENGGHAAARGEFEAFYRSRGLPRLRERVVHYAPKVGVQAGSVEVKELGYRWATCLKNGNLHFHWKYLMAPLTIIDYIVVHELCHLRHRDHTEAFWNEVDKVLPDYRERKEWLRTRGVGLDL